MKINHWEGLITKENLTITSKIKKNYSASDDHVRSNIFVKNVSLTIEMTKNFADKRLIGEMRKLLKLIQSNNFAISANNLSNGLIWDRVDICKHIAEIFDPILCDIFPPKSVAFECFRNGGTPIPFGSQLVRNNLQLISDNLFNAIGALEQSFSLSDHDELKDLRRQGESLRCFFELIYSLILAMPHQPILEWCQLCFRQADLRGRLCTLHSLSHLDDTEYRKLQNIRRKLDESENSVLQNDISIKKQTSEFEIRKWHDYHSIRRIAGDSITLLYPDDDVPTHDDSYVTMSVDPLIKLVVDMTTSADWSIAAEYWSNTISRKFPIIFSSLPLKPEECSNWNEYAQSILTTLEDAHEDTRHPFWILCILMCAEEWSVAESQNSIDGRKTKTKDEIFKLRNSGMTSPTEIAKIVGTTPQYVSKILNKSKTNSK
jgi:hypothetical protein